MTSGCVMVRDRAHLWQTQERPWCWPSGRCCHCKYCKSSHQICAGTGKAPVRCWQPPIQEACQAPYQTREDWVPSATVIKLWWSLYAREPQRDPWCLHQSVGDQAWGIRRKDFSGIWWSVHHCTCSHVAFTNINLSRLVHFSQMGLPCHRTVAHEMDIPERYLQDALTV